MEAKASAVPDTGKKPTALRIISLIAIIVFVITTAAFPLMHAFGVSPGINYENKILTERPTYKNLIEDYGSFSSTYEQYYNDYFPFRSTMLEMYSLFEYSLFNSSLLDTTSIGRDGWLFYEDFNTRQAVSGEYMLTEAELEYIYSGLMEKYNILKAMGKEYVVYLAAEKQIIYSEYDRLTVAEYTVADQLRDYLEARDCPITFIYGKDYLLEKKAEGKQLYYKYDTHWNLLGAHYGYEDVMTKAAERLPHKDIQIARAYDTSYVEASGDLAGVIFLSKYLKESAPVLGYRYTPTYEEVSPYIKVTSAVDSDLRVFVYGDSFVQSGYWGACMAQSACETRIMHNSNGFEALLGNIGESDIVIEECVQRVPTSLGRVNF